MLPHHDHTAASGTVTHIFGHRFVVQTSQGAILADLTPKGIAQVTLRIGENVTLAGEMKPTELKVTRFISGSKTIEIEHKKKHHDEHRDADPQLAMQAARAAGFDTVGQPHRKPKHFEVLGRRDEELTELHIELDGHIRKRKPVDRHDPKWTEALRHM
jgi:hypothetical protein